MAEEKLHFWCCTDAVWKKVLAAATADHTLTCEWVRDAVLEKLEDQSKEP